MNALLCTTAVERQDTFIPDLGGPFPHDSLLPHVILLSRRRGEISQRRTTYVHVRVYCTLIGRVTRENELPAPDETRE